jgi:hypothetical protein
MGFHRAAFSFASAGNFVRVEIRFFQVYRHEQVVRLLNSLTGKRRKYVWQRESKPLVEHRFRVEMCGNSS